VRPTCHPLPYLIELDHPHSSSVTSRGGGELHRAGGKLQGTSPTGGKRGGTAHARPASVTEGTGTGKLGPAGADAPPVAGWTPMANRRARGGSRAAVDIPESSGAGHGWSERGRKTRAQELGCRAGDQQVGAGE
jgi:hypothetical protein